VKEARQERTFKEKRKEGRKAGRQGGRLAGKDVKGGRCKEGQQQISKKQPGH
jgi:hypothetical protein